MNIDSTTVLEHNVAALRAPLDYALKYASFGWRVFPVHPVRKVHGERQCGCNNPYCKSPGKHPLLEHGFKEATTTAKVIRSWWTTYKAANVAIATGKVSGLVVVDVDIKPGKHGDETLAALEDLHGRLPDTVEAITGSRGRHIFFRYPDGVDKITSSAGKLGEGVDIRADGGYVVATPSNHESGNTYQWEGSSDPMEGVQLAELPGWILDKCRANGQDHSATPALSGEPLPENLCEIESALAYLSAENRDDWINIGHALKASGDARAYGVWDRWSRKAEAVYDESDQRTRWAGFAPTATHWKTIFTKAQNAGWVNPKSNAALGIGPRERPDELNDCPAEWQEPIPLPDNETTVTAAYPVHALPGAVRQAVMETARFAMVDPVAPAIVALSTLAMCIGKKARVIERRGLSHFPALFFLGIAGSGERKSGYFKILHHPVEEWMEKQRLTHETELASAKANNLVIDARISGFQSDARKKHTENADSTITRIKELEGMRKPLPPPPRLFASDITEEKLTQWLYIRGGEFAIMSGEGRPILNNILGKYSGDKQTGEGTYLAGISGDTITRDRVGNGEAEEKVIRNPCLNVCILVQPDKFLEIAGHPAMRESGAMARIQPVWIPPTAGTRFESVDDPGLDCSALISFNDLVSRLLDHNPGENPHSVSLSDDAKAWRVELVNDIEEKMQGQYADVRDIASKAVSQIVKLALVLHVAADRDVLKEPTSEISVDTWKSALDIGLFHLNESIRSQRQAEEDKTVAKAKRVLEWIKAKRLTEVTSTKLMQEGPRPRPTAAEADSILDTLTDHRYLRMRKDPNRRKPVFDVS